MVKEVLNGACSAANERGLMMASLASLTRSPQGPARLGISGHHQSGLLAMSSQQPAEGSYACSPCNYCHRSLTLHAEDPDATLAVRL